MADSLSNETRSNLVSPWLWRAAVVTLALVAILGLMIALWRGTRPTVKGASVPARDVGAWTFSPGAAGSEADGRLILHSTSEVSRVSYAISEQRWADFSFEVRAVPLIGPDDAGYGLVVRYEGPDDFVALLVGADGYIAVGQMLGGEWRWRVLWQPWPHIRRGLTQNLLRAECRADRCRFYVNDEFAFEVSDLSLEGRAGLAVWNPDGGSVSAAFSEWQVWK